MSVVNRRSVAGVSAVGLARELFRNRAAIGKVFKRAKIGASRKAPPTPPTTPRKNKMQTGVSKFNADVSDVFTPYVQRSKKSVKQKKGKLTNVKVSSSLRKKVQKVISGSKIGGSYEDIFIGGYIPIPHITNQMEWRPDFDGKAVFYSTSGTPAVHGSYPTSWSFTNAQFLNVASCLFNQKAPSQSGEFLRNTYTGNFNHRTVKFTVKSCSTTYVLKNNSDVAICLVIYNLAPKKRMSHNFENPSSKTTQNGYDGNFNISDTSAWVAGDELLYTSYSIDNANGTIKFNTDFAPVAWSSNKTPVYSGVYYEPTSCPTFGSQAKSDCTRVTINPGQMYEYHMKGPSNYDYDGRKHDNAQAWLALGMQARTLLVGTYSEPQVTALAQAAPSSTEVYAYGTRCAHSLSEYEIGKRGITSERIDKYYIELPEQTGGAASVTVGIVANTLQNRRKTVMKNLWYSTPASGAVEAVYDDQEQALNHESL